MGVLSLTGSAQGVPKDPTKALRYFLDAANAHVNKKGEVGKTWFHLMTRS